MATTLDVSWFFVGMEEFKKTVTRNIIVKIISTISIFSFVHSRNDLGIYILLLAVSTLLGNLTLWSYVKYYITLISFRNLKLKGHLFPILVLFIPQLANSIFMTMNKLVLGNLSSLSQTGYFDNSDKVVRILLAFITAIGTVIFPRIANSFAKKDHQSVEKYLTLAFNVVNLISFPIVAGVIAISHPFSSIYFGSNFDGIDLILSILVFELIFMGWSSIIGNQFLVAINKPTGLTISVFISVIISLGVSFVLVPISGAAVSAVTGEFIIAIIQLMVVRKYINIFKLFNDIPFYFFSSLLMFLASIFVSHFVTGNLFTVLVQIVTGVTVYSLLIFMFKPKSIQEILSALFLKISLK
ncbi:polysaccharide biosynthesis C-terminal domain-containing protein [Lactococcus lactis]|uniref:oligosaccharide flippase family protein n=1 Tax=Lactococcus lactis TaxID=1358 RepID=UPI00289005C9|nr:polysaccharide biosynthesis C-terminal domain-containing protein [Lactococcus lactis]MDT2907536.1 polysaccharide biosynthesis C-terminal domain-containing protein [Lactococcus lactis]MDT2923832.1 polysaccharide biosynthesis C-terminal domain-containing protein [Lactococcus lactis]MDT2950698.1 polysaccharide biosynthesis C-terminal domain-containing protein [Lactococcus lactis]